MMLVTELTHTDFATAFSFLVTMCTLTERHLELQIVISIGDYLYYRYTPFSLVHSFCLVQQHSEEC